MKIDAILGWIKLSPKYLIPVAFVAAALLFLPSDMLSRIAVDGFVDAYWTGTVKGYDVTIDHEARIINAENCYDNVLVV